MRKRSLVLFLTVLALFRFFAYDGFASSDEQRAEKKAEKEWETRKKILLEYGTRATANNEVSLRAFRDNGEADSRAMGQGKTDLVLHVLRQLSGKEKFFRAVGSLAAVTPMKSWDELQGLFEKETGRELGWFFKQWVDRKGLPDLRAESATVRRSGSRFEVGFDLVQKGDMYTLEIPVSV